MYQCEVQLVMYGDLRASIVLGGLLPYVLESHEHELTYGRVRVVYRPMCTRMGAGAMACLTRRAEQHGSRARVVRPLEAIDVEIRLNGTRMIIKCSSLQLLHVSRSQL